MVRITGADQVSVRLGRISRQTAPAVMAALKRGGAMVQREAVQSIAQHRSAGRSYRRGNIVHVASAPGYPPNADTGHLMQSVHIRDFPGQFLVTVGTPLEKGKHLEFGTRKMAARPFLRPALRKFRNAIVEGVRAAVRRTIGR